MPISPRWLPQMSLSLSVIGLSLLVGTAQGEEPVPTTETVLDDIQRTGLLKVAIRRDAAPFGYINQTGDWDGYCHDMANSLQQYLSAAWGQPIQLLEVPSTLMDRFSLVQDHTVHLECGPNTIRQDIEGVIFSTPTYVAGAYFVTLQSTPIDINASLTGQRLGVLHNTTTEQFLRQTYPNASLVYFQGDNGRADGIYALSQGQVDAFVSDGVLTYAGIEQLNLPLQNYAFIPERPLTCELYGLALPQDQPDWEATVNDFLASAVEDQVWSDWFGDAIPYVTNLYENCADR